MADILKTVDKPIRSLLPLCVKLWFDHKEGFFYLASKIPKNSYDLASKAQESVTVAHEHLETLR